MGALTDYFLFRSTRRLRGLVAATATALGGTCLLALLGVPVFGDGVDEIPWLAAAVGPFAFGCGMTLSGGCITRNLVRTGHGSLKAGLTLVVAALATIAVVRGILSPAAEALHEPMLVVNMPSGARASIGLAVAIGLCICILRPAKQRARSLPDISIGAGLGLLVPLWHLLIDAGPTPIMPAFALANTDLLSIFLGSGAALLGAAFVAGTLLGAGASACLTKSQRFEGFVDSADLQRNMAGAVLMGLGGGLIGACSFGLAVSGIAALLPTAFLGTAFMALGCRQTLRVLEGRSFFSR